MAGLFGFDINQGVEAYQSGGLFNLATNLASQRWGGGEAAPVAIPAETRAAIANPPVNGAPVNPPAPVLPAESGKGSFLSNPWVIGAIAVAGVALVMALRK